MGTVKGIFSTIVYFMIDLYLCERQHFSPGSPSLRNFVIESSGERLYIGGKNVIYVLNGDLVQIQNLATNSDNQLLLILPNRQSLITCGGMDTGLKSCEIRKLSSVSHSVDYYDRFLRCQNGRPSDTVVGLVVDPNGQRNIKDVIFVGVSYCGQDTQNYYLISARTVSPTGQFSVFADRGDPIGGVYDIYLTHNMKRNYHIYFRSTFFYGNFIYFLTNQRMYDETSPFTSKIIKLCKYAEELKAVYEDMPITCNYKGKEYPLLQHATLQPLTANDEMSSSCYDTSDCAIAIGLFSTGNDPQSPDPSGAVCVFYLHDILTRYEQSRSDRLKCSTVSTTVRNNRYLDEFIFPPDCLTENQYDRRLYNLSDINSCIWISLYTNYLIGELSLHSTAVYASNTVGLTKVAASINTGFTQAFIGTTDGRIINLYIENSTKAKELKTVLVDERKKPIIDVKKHSDQIYAMTENKIVRIAPGNCGIYTSCEKCMETKEPRCGWCILSEKCSLKANCSSGTRANFWLPAVHEKCMNLSIQPAGLTVGSVVPDPVIILLEPKPDAGNGEFKCFVNGSTRGAPLKISGDKMTCALKFADTNYNKSPANFKISIKKENAVIATTLFKVYRCADYQSCHICLSDYKDCFWCNEAAKCVDLSGMCSNEMGSNDVSRCPSVSSGQDLKIPNGEIKNINVSGSNFPSVGEFFCQVGSKQNLTIGMHDSNRVTCSSVSYHVTSENSQLKVINLTLWYKNTIIGSTDLQVYRCENLGQDCSTCRYYKEMENFECKWSSDNGCKYCGNCDDENRCSAPVISDISPLNGSVKGGTWITIRGTNFGISADEINNITLGGISCENKTDFSLSASISCRTGKKIDRIEEFAQVSVFVNNQKGSFSSSFHYKKPVLTNVKPNKIIKAGGVVLSLSGKNLNIGNRKYTVTLKDEPNKKNMACTQLSEKDDLNILCLAEAYKCDRNQMDCESKRDNVTKILVTFDEATTQEELNKTVTYVENPIIYSVKPNKSFESGGRRLTIQGTGFEYIQAAKINDIPCSITNGSEIICFSPRLNETRKRSSAEPKQIVVALDGYERSYPMYYKSDPTFQEFGGEEKVFDPNNLTDLRIEGENMNLAATEEDYIVFIGRSNCDVYKLIETYLLCIPNITQPKGGQDKRLLVNVNVTVRIGNIVSTPGYVQIYVYVLTTDQQRESILHYATYITVGVIAFVVIVVVLSVFIVRVKRSKTLKQSANTAAQQRKNKGSYQHLLRSNFGDIPLTDITLIDDATLAALKSHGIYIDKEFVIIGKEVGSGQFGLVYEGRLNRPGEDDKLVAIKTVKVETDSCIKEILEEALLMMEFNHPNVLGIIGVSISDMRYPLVILPFMKYGDLLTYLRNERNSPTVRILLKFGIDIATGMSYLVSKKFVHRDLAARNCMLDEKFVAKVGDFGLSRDIYVTDYYTCDNKKKLPFKWMAPESMEDGTCNEKSDVWSFGVLLWELMTRGASPYPGVENWQILNFLRGGLRLPRSKYCPEFLYQIMQKCWKHEPDLRPQFHEIVDEMSDIMAKSDQDVGATATVNDGYEIPVNITKSRGYFDNEGHFGHSGGSYITVIDDPLSDGKDDVNTESDLMAENEHDVGANDGYEIPVEMKKSTT